MVKVTAKIPEGLLKVIKNESERTGIGVQAIAGQLMQHGYLDLRERQRSASVNASKDKSMEASGAPANQEEAADMGSKESTDVHSDD